MAPTTSPSTSTRALATRWTTALIEVSRRGDAELAREARRELEVRRPIVRLVEDAEVAAGKAHAAEAVRAPVAAHRAHQIGAPDASFGFDAVLAGEAAGARDAVRALRAVRACRAVVAPSEVLRGGAEGTGAAIFAAFAGQTGHVPASPAGLREQPAEGRFELRAFHPGAKGSRVPRARSRAGEGETAHLLARLGLVREGATRSRSHARPPSMDPRRRVRARPVGRLGVDRAAAFRRPSTMPVRLGGRRSSPHPESAARRRSSSWEAPSRRPSRSRSATVTLLRLRSSGSPSSRGRAGR